MVRYVATNYFAHEVTLVGLVHQGGVRVSENSAVQHQVQHHQEHYQDKKSVAEARVLIGHHLGGAAD